MIEVAFDPHSPGSAFDKLVAATEGANTVPSPLKWAGTDSAFRTDAMEVFRDEQLVSRLGMIVLWPKRPTHLAWAVVIVDREGGEHAAVYVGFRLREALDRTPGDLDGWALRKAVDRVLEAWGRIQRGEPSGYGLETVNDQAEAWIAGEIRGEGNGATDE